MKLEEIKNLKPDPLYIDEINIYFKNECTIEHPELETISLLDINGNKVIKFKLYPVEIQTMLGDYIEGKRNDN